MGCRAPTLLQCMMSAMKSLKIPTNPLQIPRSPASHALHERDPSRSTPYKGVIWSSVMGLYSQALSLTLQDGIWMAPTMSEQGSTYASRCATEELSELSDCYRSYRKKLDSVRTSSHRISYRSYRKRYRTAIGKELSELSEKSYRTIGKRAIELSELSDAIEPGLSSRAT